YEVTAAGRSTGVFSAAQLAAGVNLASATADPWQPGGPWDAQAGALKSLTDARHEVGLGSMQARLQLPGSPTAEQLGKQAGGFDERIFEMQRTVARPQPYRFVVRKHEPPAGKQEAQSTTSTQERWADPKLPVRDGLELWLDANSATRE